jgi:hypothetical protein
MFNVGDAVRVKSKAEVVAEAINKASAEEDNVIAVAGKELADLEHIEASAIGNIATVKYHLKP